MDGTQNVKVDQDSTLEGKSKVSLHFTYDDDITLKELSELLDLSNKAINDFNRDNGVSNNAALGKYYSAKVESVEHGSVIVNLLVYCVCPISTSLLASFIYDRIKTLGQGAKKKKAGEGAGMENLPMPAKYPINLTVNATNINIHIHNSST